MTASRPPAAVPTHCSLCAAQAPIGFAASGGDAACNRCGAYLIRSAELLARLQALANGHPALELTEVTADSPWPLGGDSLTAVEVMLELEQELGVTISARDAERIYTVGQAIRYFDARLRASESH